MPDTSHPQRATRWPRALPVGLAALLVSGVLAAGCGGNSSSRTAATAAGASASGPSTTNAGPTGASDRPPDALAFAKCMRANGVPNFPDPSAGGGFEFSTSAIDPAAPAVKAAQAKCQKFAPHPPGGPGGGSTSSQQRAQALAQLRKVAQCMRRHGISDFPDPRTTRPASLSPGEYSIITNYEGVWLLFPATIDMQSPAWNHAAAACGALAESFNHPHH